MSRTVEYRAALGPAAVWAGASMLSGCVTKVYASGQPVHHWDDRADAAYRRSLADWHVEYHAYSHLNAQEQRDYPAWRDHHPD